MSSVLVPNGSVSCQLLCQVLVQAEPEQVGYTLCSAQLMDPSDRLQPSPTQPAAPCGLCCSLTAVLLYARVMLGMAPAGPGGTSSWMPSISPPELRSTLSGSGLPNLATGG